MDRVDVKKLKHSLLTKGALQLEEQLASSCLPLAFCASPDVSQAGLCI